jgi:hypothetical protein
VAGGTRESGGQPASLVCHPALAYSGQHVRILLLACLAACATAGKDPANNDAPVAIDAPVVVDASPDATPA